MRLETILKRYQTNNALKYLNNKKRGQKFCHYSNEIEIDGINYQVMTNTYSIIWLEKHLELPKMPDDIQYPDTTKFFNDGQDIKVSIDVDKLYGLSKQYKVRQEATHYCCIKYNDDTIYLNIKYLMDVYKLLGTIKVDAYVKNSITPILLKDKNSNSVGILCPIIGYGNIKELAKDITKYEGDD